MIGGSRLPSAQLAKTMFSLLSLLAFSYCLLAGVLYTADCLSKERREGTLGLLFLTDLRGFDVVLGKLVVTSLEALYGLLAIFPALGLPLILGGVTGSEFWRLSLLLVNTLFFSLSLGVLVSVFGRDERRTVLSTFLALILFTFGLPVLWNLAAMLVGSRWFNILLLLASPAYAYKLYPSGTSDYWLGMIVLFILAAGFIVSSSWLLPHVFQENVRSGRVHRWAAHLRLWRFGNHKRVSAVHTNDFLRNPYFWLASRDRLAQAFVWSFILGASGFGFWSSAVLSNPGFIWVSVAPYTLFGLHVVLKILVAVEASRQLNQDKRSGALELLLATRIRMSDILSGQLAVLVKLFGLAILLLFAVNLMWSTKITSANDRDLPWMVWGGLAILPFDSLALAWVGMALALQGRPYHRTVLATIGRVMVPPWTIFLGFYFFTTGVGISLAEAKTFFFFWFDATAIYDLGLVLWAKRIIAQKPLLTSHWFSSTSVDHLQIHLHTKY